MNRFLGGLVGLAALFTAAKAGAEESPYVVDAGIGTVKLKSDEFRFSGDAALGYATRTIGLVGTGFVSYYDVTAPGLTTDFFKAGGGGDAWYLTSNKSKGIHFEARVSGGGYVYSSDSITSARALLEDSVFGRGSLLLGLKLDPSDNFFLELLAGAGGQFEAYGRTNAARGATALDDQESLSLRGESRLALRWRFLPDTLGLRVKASAQTFQLTRTNSSIVASAATQTTAQSEETSKFRQTEAMTRLIVDLEAATFFGVTPGAYGGFDYLSISASAGSTTVFLPTLGLGLFKDIQ